MKKHFIVFGLSLFLCMAGSNVVAQESVIIIPKWAPGAIAAGKITLGAEYNFQHRKSVELLVGIPVPVTHTIEYDGKDSKMEVKGFSVLAGYRYYLSNREISGFYIQPYAKYVKEEGQGKLEGTLMAELAVFDTRVKYSGFGVGGQLGVQALIAKKIVLDVYILGPEANISDFSTVANDISTSFPWTELKAREAEADMEEIIRDIPIIGDKTEISVDASKKQVDISYNGFLPSVRFGISLGVRL